MGVIEVLGPPVNSGLLRPLAAAAAAAEVGTTGTGPLFVGVGDNWPPPLTVAIRPGVVSGTVEATPEITIKCYQFVIYI